MLSSVTGLFAIQALAPRLPDAPLFENVSKLTLTVSDCMSGSCCLLAWCSLLDMTMFATSGDNHLWKSHAAFCFTQSTYTH